MNSKTRTRKIDVKAKDLPARDGRDVRGGLLTTFIANLKKNFEQQPRDSGGCEDWGCGSTNHNETLLRG
jgi:hypothetical protein